MFNPGIAVIAKQKKIIRRFKNIDATTPERAIDPFVLGLKNGIIFRRLVGRGILIEASPSLFYLDEQQAEVFSALRRRVAFGVMIVLSVIVTVICVFAW